MEKLDAALADIALKATALAEKHGPEVVSAAAFVMQLTAVKMLVIWGLLLVVGAPLAAWAVAANGKWLAAAKEGDKGWHAFWIGVFAVTAGTFLVGGLVHLADPIIWHAATNPHFAIAAKALGKL